MIRNGNAESTTTTGSWRGPVSGRWVSDSSPRARRFYERLGFRTTGQRGSLPSAPEIGEELLQRYLGV